jgi:hypothetical protein
MGTGDSAAALTTETGSDRETAALGDTDQSTETDQVLDTAASVNPLILSEIADPSVYQARFVEIYNAGNTDASLYGIELRRYSNGSSSPSSFALPNTTIAPNGTVVIAYSDTAFATEFGVTADLVWGGVNSNGDDVYALATTGAPNDVVLDVYGVIGVDGTGTPWEFSDRVVNRLGRVTTSSDLFELDEWVISDDPADFTPGIHPAP